MKTRNWKTPSRRDYRQEIQEAESQSGVVCFTWVAIIAAILFLVGLLR